MNNYFIEIEKKLREKIKEIIEKLEQLCEQGYCNITK